MSSFDNIMKNTIKGSVLAKRKQNKKQISTFFTQSTIDKLDKCVKDLKDNSDMIINRNSLIEFAVETLVNNYEVAINEYMNKHEVNNQKNPIYDFDTIVCPSDSTGLNVFVKEKKWYYVRINESKIEKIKYVAIYLGSPLSRITHYGKVKKIVYNEDMNKYKIYLDGDAIELNNHIPLGHTNPLATRSIKYTTLKKLKSAKEYSDLNLGA